MANSPVDVSQDFTESGMRLITSPSSDALLRQHKEKAEATKTSSDDPELWDPTTGPIE